MADFTMPSLGADMDVGTILEWLVEPGAEVHRGDVVAVVDTAKAAVEVEVFTDGVVDEIVVPVGEQVPVGTLLARLSPLGAATPAAEVAPAAPVDAAAPEAPAAAAVPAAPPVTAPAPAALVTPPVRHLAHVRGVDLAAVTGSGPHGAVTRDDVEHAATRRGGRASPYARRRAAELGVDLSALSGTGHEGAVGATDVERAAAQRPTPAPPRVPEQVHPAAAEPTRAAERQQAMRQAIGALMARSKREVPHYYLATTVDLTRAMAWLHEANRARPLAERVLPAVLLLKATALACRDVPQLNGFWSDDGFVPAEHVHLGVAVALRGGGLVAPALHDAETLGVDALMSGLRDLVARTRAGRMRNREMTEATITVTNLGEQGVEAVYGVIYPPQVALVGFGKVVERPWAVDGLLGVRPVVTATLSADHRATDGHLGARFLSAIDHWLQVPEKLEGGVR